jgi:hypothetical protein
MVSGAPWHMRTLNLDGGGARNQDRSIQPSAVFGELPPFALNPTPTPPSAANPAPPGGPPGAPAAPNPPTGSRPTLPPTETAPLVRTPVSAGQIGLWIVLLCSIGFTLALTRRPRRPPR